MGDWRTICALSCGCELRQLYDPISDDHREVALHVASGCSGHRGTPPKAVVEPSPDVDWLKRYQALRRGVWRWVATDNDDTQDLVDLLKDDLLDGVEGSEGPTT